MFTYNDPRLKRRRQALRTARIPAEVKLWGYLRGKRMKGLRFWRQYSIGPYVVDFYYPKVRLVVEVDGDSHFLPGAREYDQKREQFIRGFNIRIIRFLNSDVHKNIDGVLQRIEEVIDAYHPLSPSSPLSRG